MLIVSSVRRLNLCIHWYTLEGHPEGIKLGDGYIPRGGMCMRRRDRIYTSTY